MKQRLIPVLTVAAVLTLAAYALAQVAATVKTPSPAGAKVYFIEPKDGATVKGPVRIVMGLAGMGVAPAGVNLEGTGHHHVLVDVDKVDPNAPLPMDDKHRHFGRGQTETMLELPAGRHTLQLVLGDRNHVPHDPPVMSPKITITVQ
jgi:hypothetical protein